MCPLLKNKNVDPNDFWLGCQILRLSGRCEYYKNLASVDEEDIFRIVSNEDLPEKIVDEIIKRHNVCPFFALARLAEKSDYIVATYPYIFDPDLQEIIFGERDISEFSVVVDEAHMLSMPSRIFSEEFSTNDIKHMINEIHRWLGDLPLIRESLNKLLNQVSKIGVGGGLRKIDKKEVGLDDHLIDLVIDASIEIKKKVLTELLERRGVEEALSRKVYSVKIATALSALKDERFDIFVSKESSEEAFIKIAAVDFSVIGEVLNRYKKILLMSGTPPTQEFFRDLIGLKDLEYIDVREFTDWSPIDSMAIIIATELSSKYEERGEVIYKLYADYIKIFREEIDHLKMIVYPSYDFMRNILKYLDLDKDLVEDQKTKYEDFLDNIFIERDATLHVVAGGKIAEGIEFVDKNRSLLKAVFIAGTPYPQPDDYLKELVKRRPKDLDEEIFRRRLLLNEAFIRSAQAMGRAVRSPEDRALIVLGDRRFLSKELREMIGFKRAGFARNIFEFRSLVKKVVEEYI
jgi:DNA excision repair protein ERCC-2